MAVDVDIVAPGPSLIGQVALVTGGSRGIGFAVARLLAERGSTVVIGARSDDEVGEATESLRRAGWTADGLSLDVTTEESVRHAVDYIRETYGPISILVNNAGVMLLRAFAATSLDDWERTQAVNVRGPFLCARAVVPDMLEARSGVIVNVGSIWGTRGGPQRAAYIASKHAVIGLTRALAAELGPGGVRVYGVNPGPVKTSMTISLAPESDQQGWLEPEDVARTITFLCGDETAAMNGAVVDVFGLGSPAAVG